MRGEFSALFDSTFADAMPVLLRVMSDERGMYTPQDVHELLNVFTKHAPDIGDATVKTKLRELLEALEDWSIREGRKQGRLALDNDAPRSGAQETGA